MRNNGRVNNDISLTWMYKRNRRNRRRSCKYKKGCSNTKGVKMITVELKTDENIVILSTYELGNRIAREQVMDKINKGKVIIKIPDNIRVITSSFVEGFIYVLSEKMDIRDFFEKIEVKGTDKVVSNFNKFVIR